LFLNELSVPSGRLRHPICLSKADSHLEVCQIQLSANILKHLNQIESYRSLSIGERAIQMELKALLEKVDAFWQLSSIPFEAIFDQKCRNQVKEDENASASAESNLDTRWLQLEALTHRSLDIIGIVRRHVLKWRLARDSL